MLFKNILSQDKAPTLTRRKSRNTMWSDEDNDSISALPQEQQQLKFFTNQTQRFAPLKQLLESSLDSCLLKAGLNSSQLPKKKTYAFS